MSSSIVRAHFLLLTLLTVGLLAPQCTAEEWKWNPFSKGDGKRASSPLYPSKSSSSKKSWMPEWLGGKKPAVNSYVRKEPSTLEKMSKSMSKLNPLAKSKGYSAEPKKASFASWFKPEEKKVETVNDFLKQEMVPQ